MEHTTSHLILLCLSAVVYLAQCQTYEPCPEDFMENRDKYSISSFPDTSLLEPRRCSYPFQFGSLVYTYNFFIYECKSGFTAVEIVADSGIYVCDAVDDTTTDGVSPSTEPTASPTSTVAPTEAERIRCPSEHQTRNYLYSTVRDGLIEQKDCYIPISVQGASAGEKRSSYWVCKEGYVRTHVRGSRYKCEEITN